MKTIKGENSKGIIQNESQLSASLLYKWKLYELHILGIRIDQCVVAIDEYRNIPKAYKTINPSCTNMGDIWMDITKYIVSVSNHPDKLQFLLDGIYESPIILEALKKGSLRVKKGIADNLNLTTNGKIFEYLDERIKEINIYERESLELLCELCVNLSACGYDYKKMTDDEKEKFLMEEHVLRSKACEAIGYWTCRLEEMRKNKNNVKTKTTKKENNKATLKEWMNTMKPSEYRLRAQKEFERTDRTILKWLQEIKDEKTAILRKKDEAT